MQTGCPGRACPHVFSLSARRAGEPISPPTNAPASRPAASACWETCISGLAAPRAESGGFRATSGLIVGGVRPLAGSDSTLLESATVPYLGVGYSNAWPKSGWRFSADLGLVSLSPSGATGIGRVIGGSQSLDDLVRDMRLAPVVQLGVSYSF